MTDSPGPKGPDTQGLATTLELLDRIKDGDNDAMEALVARSLPPLRRWARGRLPQRARSLAETNDLVQQALIRALPQLKRFEARYPGALQAYLRQAVANHIRDEIRRAERRPVEQELPEEPPSPAPSPLEIAIGRQGFELYEAALQKLRAQDRDAIIARMELQQSYEEVAIALGKPSAEAARVAVGRAIKELITVMSHMTDAR